MTNMALKLDKYISNDAFQTKILGEKLAKQIQGGEVIFLYGDLGSGKTTFTQGFINYFIQNKRVPSPTFIIVRQYDVKHAAISKIYHVDLYRLETMEDIQTLGILELFNNPNNVFLIEWPEKLDKHMIKNRINVKFNIINGNKREIKIYG